MACGNGLYFQITTEYQSYGLDLSEKLISISSNRYPYVNHSVANALETPYHNSMFDIVMTVGLIQHLTDSQQIKLIDEVIRILDINGIAFISGMIDISNIPEINRLITFCNTLKYNEIKQSIEKYCLEGVIELLQIKNVQHSVIFIIKKLKNLKNV